MEAMVEERMSEDTEKEGIGNIWSLLFQGDLGY